MLDIVGLNVGLRGVPLVTELSLRIEAGETVCIVGESGSGKSLTAQAVMRLLPADRFAVTAGRLRFAGTELLGLPERAMTRLRGDRIAMVFQEPMTSLNPVFTVGDQIGEVLRLHRDASRGEARQAALRLLRDVQVPAPERRLDAYPHELSGGLRQRVTIAMALACDPGLLIADEPTTALDVTVQAQVLALLAGLRRRLGMAMLFITHDLGVVAEIADRVAVMYAGEIVEEAPAAALFGDAQHPYTLALLAALPSAAWAERLEPIPGRMGEPGMPGCRFRPRCPFAARECEAAQAMRVVGPEHAVRCCRAPVEGLA